MRYFQNTRFVHIVALIVVILFAFWLRMFGLEYGLPFVEYFTSDAEHYVADAIRIAGTGDWNPRWFGHPGSTIIYPLAIVFKIIDYAQKSEGSDFSVLFLFQQNPTIYYVIGRLYTIFLGVLTIALTYRIGKYVGNRTIAIVAALLIAISPLHIFISQLARTDTPVVFFVTLSILGSVSIVRSPSWKNYMLTGVAIGLATSSKYYGVVAVSGLMAAHFVHVFNDYQYRRSWNYNLWYKFAVSLFIIPLTFALTSPFALIEWETTKTNLTKERRMTHLGADGLPLFGNIWWYVNIVLPKAIGWIAVWLIPVGVWVNIRDEERRNVTGVLLTFILFFILGISIQYLHWDRWLTPVLPELGILAAIGLCYIATITCRIVSMCTKPLWVIVIFLIVASINPLSSSLMRAIDRTLPDTRMLTREWMINNIPNNSKIALEHYTAPLEDTNFILLKRFFLSDQSIEYYCQEKVEYLGISSKVYERFDLDPVRYRSNINFYNSLTDTTTLIYEIKPLPGQIAGPVVSIYHLSICNDK